MITSKVDNGNLMLVFEEPVDASNAMELQDEVFKLCAENGVYSVTLDADNTKSISSAALRLLMKLTKITNNNITVINANPIVYDTLEYTGFGDLISVQMKQNNA